MDTKTIKEYNEIVRKAIISAIDFQKEIEWDTSYVPNGQIIAPDSPDDMKEITSIQFSIALDRNLRDDIVDKIEKTENKNVSFQLYDHNQIHHTRKTANGRDMFYYTAKITVIPKVIITK